MGENAVEPGFMYASMSTDPVDGRRLTGMPPQRSVSTPQADGSSVDLHARNGYARAHRSESASAICDWSPAVIHQ